MERITNTEVQEFLKDFEENSQILILEEGQEKSELEKIALARGMKVKGSKDLAMFKTIYAFTDKPNANGAILPKKELLKVLPQIIGKPVNINHNRRFVVGHYIDYKYSQKDNRIMAYGVFYKSYFGEEWERAQELFKKNKLSSSFEIWSSDEDREDIGNGKYKLHSMEIAGGALIYETRDNKPAFKDAKVLTLATKNVPELVYAKKYKCNEVITSSGVLKCINCGKCKEETDSLEASDSTQLENPVKEITMISKVACSNCKEELEYNGIGDINCPKCFAILDRSGNMIYPPQVKDFKVLCPSCKVNRWRIIKKDETNAKLRCLHCSKEYQVTFDTTKPDEILNKIDFIYTGSITCYQCNNRNYVSGVSSIRERTVKCKRCGLEFSYDIMREMYKKISKIEEIKTIDIKSSEKGGNKMAKEKKIEQKDEAKVKEEKVETKVKSEEKPKIEETPKAGDTPKPEEKVKKAEVKKDEKKETPAEAPKAEEKPKVKEANTEKAEDHAGKKEKKVEVKTKPAKAVDSVSGEKKDEKIVEKVEAKKEEKSDDKTGKKVDEKISEKPTKEKIEEAKETKEQKYAKGIRKLASEIKSLNKQLELYKANAKEIIKRREELGAEIELTDEDILNDDKFGKAKAEKENLLLKAQLETSSETVGTKLKGDDYYAKKRKEINKEAFKHLNK